MNYVIDTSVAFKWVVAESDSAKAIALRDDYTKGVHTLLAADIFPSEIANALLMAERGGRIKAGEWGGLFADIMTSCPVLYPAGSHIPRAYEIASLIRETIYDCLYIALAESESCEFVTADDKLVRKAQPQFSFVVSLSALP